MRSNLHVKIDGVKYAAAERTFRRYGLADLFRDHPDIAPSPPGVYNRLVTLGKHVGETGRDLLFGSPISMVKKLEQNYQQTKSVPKSLGKYIKEWYLDPTTPTWVRALSIGLPIYGVGSALLSSDRARLGENLSESLVGLASSPITAKLGPAGQEISLGARRAAAKATASLAHQKRPKNVLTERESDVPE